MKEASWPPFVRYILKVLVVLSTDAELLFCVVLLALGHSELHAMNKVGAKGVKIPNIHLESRNDHLGLSGLPLMPVLVDACLNTSLNVQ